MPALTRGFRRSVVTGVALALLLSGCSTSPTAAATIGGTTISLSTIQDQVDSLTAVPVDTLSTDRLSTAIRISTNRTLLADAVLHQILADRGLLQTLTKDQVQQVVAGFPTQVSLTQGLQVPEALFDERVGDSLALFTVLRSTIATGTVLQSPTADVDFLSYQDQAAVDADARKFAADPAAMTAAIAADGGTNGGTRSLPYASAATLAAYGLFSSAPGTIVVIPQQQGAIVVRVNDVRSESTPVTADSLAQLTPRSLNALGGLALAQSLHAEGVALPEIDVNPRFGRWDPTLLTVVAS